MDSYSKDVKVTMRGFLESPSVGEQQVAHVNCQCHHCINNTRPLQRPKAARIIGPTQKTLENNQAYSFLLKKLAKHSYYGRASIPDVFLVEEAILIYPTKGEKVRQKDNQTNMDIKKHFDEQRKKIGPSYLASLLVLSMPLGQEQPKTMRNSRQIALLRHTDGTQKLTNDVLLNKIFQKRKNDPFWQEISYIMLIPPQASEPIQKAQYHYMRTKDTIKELAPVLTKVGDQMDRLEQRNFHGENNRFGAYKQEQGLEFNPEASSKNFLKKRTSSIFLTKTIFDKDLEAKQATLEIVAFIELTTNIRILNATFDYFVDKKCIFCGIKDMIYDTIQGLEITMLHQRYYPMQQIEIEQINIIKDHFDQIQEQELLKICTAVVNQCLDRRKQQLKLKQYKKPSSQILLKIFNKIFPDFDAKVFFNNRNWKNQLSSFVEKHKKQVNRIIRQDQGIRILRRFGIQFRRTFQ